MRRQFFRHFYDTEEEVEANANRKFHIPRALYEWLYWAEAVPDAPDLSNLMKIQESLYEKSHAPKTFNEFMKWVESQPSTPDLSHLRKAYIEEAEDPESWIGYKNELSNWLYWAERLPGTPDLSNLKEILSVSLYEKFYEDKFFGEFMEWVVSQLNTTDLSRLREAYKEEMANQKYIASKKIYEWLLWAEDVPSTPDLSNLKETQESLYEESLYMGYNDSKTFDDFMEWVESQPDAPDLSHLRKEYQIQSDKK